MFIQAANLSHASNSYFGKIPTALTMLIQFHHDGRNWKHKNTHESE